MIQQQSNLVEVRGVSFSRGDRTIFDDISLTVPKGKVTAIMGPSGIGKTTLLRLIGGNFSRPVVKSFSVVKTFRHCLALNYTKRAKK